MTQHETAFPDVPWLPREHHENRRKIPPEQLLAYAGQFVAWSWEGDQIVGAATSEEALWQQLVDVGIDPRRVVFSYLGDVS